MFNYKNNLSETLVYFDDIKITISNLNYFFTQKILYQFGHNLFLSGYGVYSYMADSMTCSRGERNLGLGIDMIRLDLSGPNDHQG